MSESQDYAGGGLSASEISRRQMLKRLGLLGLALPLGFSLAACGDDATTAVTSGSGSTQPAKKVRLGWSTGGLTLYAKTRGVFEASLAKKNISVEWVGPFPNHAPSLQAVVGGSADFGFGGSSTPALAAILAGNPLVFTSLIITDPRTTAIIAKPESGIKSVKDLVGKKVAVNRSGLGEFILIAALEKYGIPFDKVERIYLNPPDADPAFGNGSVDAWAIWTGPREIAEFKYGATPIFVEGDELGADKRIDVASFLVLEEYAKKNPDVVRAVLDGYKVEAEWASNNPKEVTDLLAKQSGWTPPVVDKIASYRSKSVLIAPDDKATFDLQKAADWLAERGVLPGKIEVAKHFAKLPV
jgi:sulfonate transport system substrate-binding protein